MRFEYEITPDDYVSSQLLYQKIAKPGHRYKLLVWLLVAVGMIALAIQERDLNWTPAVVALIGAWWIYWVFLGLFPGAYIRRQYPKDLPGKKYVAVVDPDGFEVTGDVCAWRVKWPGVTVRGENAQVMIFYAANTIFMFGKKYLTSEQLSELKDLAKM